MRPAWSPRRATSILLRQVGAPRTRARMRKLLIVVALGLPSLARAATWTLDPAHTSVQFSVRHLMVSTVRGAFGKVTGTVQVDEKDLARSKIQATIDAASIDTRIEKRDAHLKSPDFLDVAKYPTITFVSKKIEQVDPGHFKVTGDLTLHGVTREVSLDVEGPTPEIKDPQGKVRAGAQATTKINRKDFGVTWNQALEAGVVAGGAARRAGAGGQEERHAGQVRGAVRRVVLAPDLLVGHLVPPHAVVGRAEHIVKDVEADPGHRLHVAGIDGAREAGGGREEPPVPRRIAHGAEA